MKRYLKLLACSAVALAVIWVFVTLAFAQDKKPEPELKDDGIFHGGANSNATFVTNALVSPPQMMLTKARFDGTIDGKQAFVELDYTQKGDRCDAVYTGTFTLADARQIFENRYSSFYVRLCNETEPKK
jgi:hypothetical protein